MKNFIEWLKKVWKEGLVLSTKYERCKEVIDITLSNNTHTNGKTIRIVLENPKSNNRKYRGNVLLRKVYCVSLGLINECSTPLAWTDEGNIAEYYPKEIFPGSFAYLNLALTTNQAMFLCSKISSLGYHHYNFSDIFTLQMLYVESDGSFTQDFEITFKYDSESGDLNFV